MPTVLRLEGFKFFFYSDEGDPREPPHIHVFKVGQEAKFWLTPEVKLARNDGYDAKTLRKVATLVTNHRNQLEKAWNEYFT